MDKLAAPSVGATFSRPCNLESIRPSLQSLASRAKANGQNLTPIQADYYRQLCEAWEFYRQSQPAMFRSEVDDLVNAIGAFRVGVAS